MAVKVLYHWSLDQCCKTFYDGNLRVFIPGKPFQLSLMLTSKPGAYPSEAPYSCSKLLALPQNIRFGQKGLSWPDTLAY